MHVTFPDENSNLQIKLRCRESTIWMIKCKLINKYLHAEIMHQHFNNILGEVSMWKQNCLETIASENWKMNSVTCIINLSPFHICCHIFSTIYQVACLQQKLYCSKLVTFVYNQIIVKRLRNQTNRSNMDCTLNAPLSQSSNTRKHTFLVPIFRWLAW